MSTPTPDPTAGERPHNCDGWDSCPNPAHRVTTAAPDPTAGEGLSEVLHAHQLHASMNHCLACYWRPTTDAGSLAEQHARHVATVLEGHVAARVAAAATRARAELRKVLDEYFDFSVDSWDETATPEPEDVWRLHRDLKAILAPDTAGESA